MSRDNKAYNNILELIGNTPLVRLNKICDGFPGKYFTKYEGYNPGHSNKDRIALHILNQAEKKKILKKVKNASIKMALSEKMKEGTVTIIDKLNVKDISTKKLNKIVNDLDLPKKSHMLLEKSEINESILKSSSNIPNVKTIQVDLINTYDLLNSNHLLITQEGFKKIEEIWGSKKAKK